VIWDEGGGTLPSKPPQGRYTSNSLAGCFHDALDAAAGFLHIDPERKTVGTLSVDDEFHAIVLPDSVVSVPAA